MNKLDGRWCVLRRLAALAQDEALFLNATKNLPHAEQAKRVEERSLFMQHVGQDLLILFHTLGSGHPAGWPLASALRHAHKHELRPIPALFSSFWPQRSGEPESRIPLQARVSRLRGNDD